MRSVWRELGEVMDQSDVPPVPALVDQFELLKDQHFRHYSQA